MLVTVPNDKWGCFNTTGSGLGIGTQQFPGPVKSTYTRQIKVLSIHQINNPSAGLWLNALKKLETGIWSLEICVGKLLKLFKESNEYIQCFLSFHACESLYSSISLFLLVSFASQKQVTLTFLLLFPTTKFKTDRETSVEVSYGG